MVLLIILSLIALILAFITIATISAIGVTGIVIFGDVIVCIVFIVLLIRWLVKRKK